VALGGDLTNESSVLSFVTHALGEVVHDGFTVGSVIECFDVCVGVLLRSGFVGYHDDAGVTSFLEDTFQGLG